MKVQFVFSSFLLFSFLGESFGDIGEESDIVVLDSMDVKPERRAPMYDPVCLQVPVPDNPVFSRVMYPKRNSKFTSQKSSLAYGKIQFPRYQDKNSNSPASSSNIFKNLPDFPAFQYPGKRIPINNNGPFEQNGQEQRYPFNPMQNFGVEGQYVGADNTKHSGRVFMMSLRNKKEREIYRRMLDAADAEEEEELEDAQED